MKKHNRRTQQIRLEMLEGRNLLTTLVLEPSLDSTIFEDSATLSNGVGEYLFSGATANRNANLNRRAMMAFDIAASLPAGATIDSAELELFMDRVPPAQVTNDMALHRILKQWGEGDSDAPGQEGRGAVATNGDTTWESAVVGGEAWDTPGGDFVSDSSSSTSVGNVGSYTWDSTDALVADLQLWLDDPGTNFGWILIGDESTSKTAKRFAARENAVPTLRPKLTIEFTEAVELPLPTVSAGDISVAEGDSGTSQAVATVELSGASTEAVTVQFATVAGTATTDDFVATSGEITFAAGETQKTIEVPIVGDDADESDESFTIELTSAVNAELPDGRVAATVTIVDDDETANPFPWNNADLPEDVTGDGAVAPNDALTIINRINSEGSGPLSSPTDGDQPPPFLDVNGDGQISPQDVLLVINRINNS